MTLLKFGGGLYLNLFRMRVSTICNATHLTARDIILGVDGNKNCVNFIPRFIDVGANQ